MVKIQSDTLMKIKDTKSKYFSNNKLNIGVMYGDPTTTPGGKLIA